VQTTLAQFNESESEDRFSLQNPRMLRLHIDGDEVHVRTGTLVACQGEVQLAGAEAPAGAPLTAVTGRGRVFLADQAQNVHLIELEAETVSCHADRVLAVDAGVAWSVRDVASRPGGAIRELSLAGSGWLALLSHGAPVLLDVSAGATLVRATAAIAWADGVEAEPADEGLTRFHGLGWVLVQASPTVPEPTPAP
jgi:uncharacterized protein (AIM24 family)